MLSFCRVSEMASKLPSSAFVRVVRAAETVKPPTATSLTVTPSGMTALSVRVMSEGDAEGEVVWVPCAQLSQFLPDRIHHRAKTKKVTQTSRKKKASMRILRSRSLRRLAARRLAARARASSSSDGEEAGLLGGVPLPLEPPLWALLALALSIKKGAGSASAAREPPAGAS